MVEREKSHASYYIYWLVCELCEQASNVLYIDMVYNQKYFDLSIDQSHLHSIVYTRSLYYIISLGRLNKHFNTINI